MAMRSFGLAVVLFVAALCAEEPAPQKGLAEAAKTLPDKLAGKPLAFIPLVADAPGELKGDLSHDAWKRATPLSLSVNTSGDEPKFKTSAKAFCTKEAIYIGVDFEEPDLEHAKTDGAIWERDGFEFILFAGEDIRQKLYNQVIVDQSNQIQFYQTHIYPKHGNACPQSGTWGQNVKSATAKSKTGWTAELRVPFDDLSPTKDALSGKSLWRMAIYRNRPARGDEKGQNYAWSPTLADSYHCSWRFGYIALEPFASEELIRKVIERKKKEAEKTAEIVVSDAVKKEVKTLIEKLGHEVFQERSTAQEKLAAMISDDPAAETFAEDALRTAERETDDAEVRSRARKLLASIRGKRNPDEDPLPGGQRFVGPDGIQLDM